MATHWKWKCPDPDCPPTDLDPFPVTAMGDEVASVDTRRTVRGGLPQDRVPTGPSVGVAHVPERREEHVPDI